MAGKYASAIALDRALRELTKLRDEGVIWMHKPEIVNGAADFREPLPEDAYEAVITEWELREKAEKYWPEDVGEHPWKKFQYSFSMKVADGDFKDRYLPRKYTTVRLSTHERNGLFNFLKLIIPDIKKRIEAGDAPDFDTEVVGKHVVVDLEINEETHRNKLANIRKSKFKPSDKDLPLSEGGLPGESDPTKDEEPSEIPFAYRGSCRQWWNS